MALNMKTAINKLSALFRRWFPVRPDVEGCKVALARFYAENKAYRQMIGGAGKLGDPQVRLLNSRVAGLSSGIRPICVRTHVTARLTYAIKKPMRAVF